MKIIGKVSTNTAAIATTTYTENVDTFINLTTTQSDQSPHEAFTPVVSLGAAGAGTFAITSSQASYAIANSILSTMRKSTSVNK